MFTQSAAVMSPVPAETIEWLLEAENPAVAVLTRRTLLGEADDAATARCGRGATSTRRSPPSWRPSWRTARGTSRRDYQKYRRLAVAGRTSSASCGRTATTSACGARPTTRSRGSSPTARGAANPQARTAIACLTANVGRALARLGWRARRARRRARSRTSSDATSSSGSSAAGRAPTYQLNGYCHMLAPKVLLFLGEVPRELWPDGAEELRDDVRGGAARQGGLPLPARGVARVPGRIWPRRRPERAEVRERFLAEHPPLHYKRQAGLAAVRLPAVVQLRRARGALARSPASARPRRPEYEPALEVVRSTADERDALDAAQQLQRQDDRGRRDARAQPSKWLTLRALQVLGHFG